MEIEYYLQGKPADQEMNKLFKTLKDQKEVLFEILQIASVLEGWGERKTSSTEKRGTRVRSQAELGSQL